MGIPVTGHLQADPRARHTMDQLPWIYSELAKRQLLPGRWVPVCRKLWHSSHSHPCTKAAWRAPVRSRSIDWKLVGSRGCPVTLWG